MKRNFTLLLATLLACTGVMKAAVTDLPKMTSDLQNPKYYTIKNTRSGKYASYVGDGKYMTQVASPLTTAAALFYFTAAEAETAEGFTPVMIHHHETANMLADFDSWTAEGKAWYLVVDSLNATPEGLHITNTAKFEGFNAFNDKERSSITYYLAKDGGSVFVLEEVTDFTTVINIAALKEDAKAELERLSQMAILYPSTTEVIAAVEEITAASNQLADLDAAAKAIAELVENYKVSSAQAFSSKYFTIHTPGRPNGYMKMAATKVIGASTSSTPATIWQFVSNGKGEVNIYNPYTKNYLCEPADASSIVAVTSEQASAGAYTLNVSAEDSGNDGAIIKLTSNGKSVHMDSGHTLVRWDSGDASEWNITEITDFSAIIDLQKAAILPVLNCWDTLNVVFDADLVDAAKTEINNIDASNWDAIITIDAALKSVIYDATEKRFSFRNSHPNAPRANVYLAVNDTAGCGSNELLQNAIWKLEYAENYSFYLYNEVAEAYLGKPSDKAKLQADVAEAAAYSFEVVEAATNKVELKSGSQTLHLAGDCLLMDYDWDDAASRWYVANIDIDTDTNVLLEDVDTPVQSSVAIYDLLGRRVEKMEKGLYIVNGKKVVLK